jgi:serine protease Do
MKPKPLLAAAVAVILAILAARANQAAAQSDDGAFSPKQIYQMRKHAVVSIKTDKGNGTGFIILTDAMVLTNAHVTKDASEINVETYDKKTFRAYRIFESELFDVTALKIPPQQHYLPIREKKVAEDDTGETIFVIGNNFGLDYTITQGIVSQVRFVKHGLKIIQIDAAVNEGSSGSPVIDQYGNAIGIVTMKNEAGEGLGFAVATDNLFQ